MNTRLILSLVAIVVLLTSVGGATAHNGAYAPAAPSATAVGSGFTFQGQLKNAGATVNGNCDMTFRLYDAAATGMQIGSTITATVPVSNSLFTVILNANGEYGANAFNGYARWLEVSVKCVGDAAFTTLTPRQQITAAPYAQYSLTVDNASQKPFIPLYRPQTLDLAAVDSQLKGFFGGFTDGRYGYFVPCIYASSVASGKVARVDLQNFTTGGVTTLDLTTVDPELKYFYGGFTDGRYGYFVPTGSPVSIGKFVRVDLQNFTAAGVTVLDLTTVDSRLKGYTAGFTDGRYGYLVPVSGLVTRVDLQNFAAGGVSFFDLRTIDTDLVDFRSGFTDGRYGYLAPNNNGSAALGKFVRISLQNFAVGGVTVLDLTTASSGLKGFFGSFTDGRYGYLTPSNNGVQDGQVARVDLQNFATSGVTMLDLATIDPALIDFGGGFTDGRYGYFVPYTGQAGGWGLSGKLARVDLQNFSFAGVTVLDLSTTDPDLKGFMGGFTEGKYAYFVPFNNGTNYFGKVARIQLLSGAGTP